MCPAARSSAFPLHAPLPRTPKFICSTTAFLPSTLRPYLSKTMSIELGILGGGRVNFAHDDETDDWYICRADDSEGFIVWKDKRCARFSAGFIVQRLMRQAKVERKSVQFMMARMPVEIGGVAYYKILLSNPILR